ncbi:uncharacterized protein KY384_002093 [Bacidia gigantensis]|uniref:uncharacterized protein n=1 Tax=Bacidia gigantensis TaxID=2732470 RepID=UPI001D04249A|nr:uncharacterized protein KY384_002093 [Bacidia gigantensis]KAG8533310.1 hypothetical protein KY384_002093 [Bacidia gigantensis]
MSAILSADDLNDFISPGVACIKPVENLPRQQPASSNLYEVAKEGQLPEDPKTAQISLTDCLACSGCVTSAEAVLVSLQSHAEVLNTLNSEGKLFVASVSPQVRASIGATYGVSEKDAGWMIDQLLSGPQGLAMGGSHGNHFKWVVDTNAMREASLVLAAEEVAQSLSVSEPDASPKRPILTSACPGWICYAEKSHAHVLPHLSQLKSPQALTGILLKTVLGKQLNLRPDQIWHVAIMPCFDKKLEASREELTDVFWDSSPSEKITPPIRDVDCVITARELLMLADTRGISFPNLPRRPLQFSPFPEPTLHSFLFPRARRRRQQPPEAGTSGGYLHHILQSQLSLHPHSALTSKRGHNADVIEYTITSSDNPSKQLVFKSARYYGFRNIQNLVRKLKPVKASRMPGARSSKLGARTSGGGSNLDGYAYVEVMACPGGCTNGGGQIKVDDLPGQSGKEKGQKDWLASVDEAYFSLSEGDDEAGEDSDMADAGAEGQRYEDEINGISPSYVKHVLKHWEDFVRIPLEKLVQTTYRKVESDVGKIGEPDPTSKFMAF